MSRLPRRNHSAASKAKAALAALKGEKTLTELAHHFDKPGLTSWFQTLSITVVAVPKPPMGNLDLAVDSVSGSSPVHRADSVYVQGWAADYQANGPVESVTVVIDGAAFGTAMLGQSRPDVAASCKILRARTLGGSSPFLHPASAWEAIP